MATLPPTQDHFKAGVRRLLASAVAFNGIVYRSTTPAYAKAADLLNGEGSRGEGGRWNPVGIAAVCASLTPETAMAEALAHNRYYAISIADAMPRTFVAMSVRLTQLIDLRDRKVRQRLRVSLRSILATDWRKEAAAGRKPITQMIGRAVAEIGLAGLIAPSAADREGHNLVVFPANLKAGSMIRVLHGERLAN